MAKKGKAKRPSGARGKKKAPKKGVKKKVASKAMAKQPPTGLEDPKEVNFNFLKEQMKAHINRLASAPNQTDKVRNAHAVLVRAQAELTGECSPTMVIPTS